MNYNDKIYSEEGFVLHTEQDECYQETILKQSDINSKSSLNSSKYNKKGTIKIPLIRGKQNDSQTFNNYNKKCTTNHSFNGFFNQNIKKMKPTQRQQIDQKFEFSNSLNNNIQFNSSTNFNISGKLSNLKFVGDSSKNYNISNKSNKNQKIMHLDVQKFMKKYFPNNYQSMNFYAQYVSLTDFVDILLEEFESIIGNHNPFNMVDQFTDKVFLIFGDIIYFEELFQKTLEQGLIGLIFQIVKSIQQDFKNKNESGYAKKLIVPTKQVIPDKNSVNSSYINLKNPKNSRSTIINQNLQSSKQSKNSLDIFFGNSIPKGQYQEEQSTGIQQQNLDEVKQVLQSFIQEMYSEAQSKLNKKYTQQMKKVTLKYKEVQKLLQKINQKISNHYDSLQLQKQCQKKLKNMIVKQKELQEKVTKLEYQIKSTKEESEKHKCSQFKLQNEIVKLKQKLQKYQNAIFQKAMQKDSNKDSNNQNASLGDTFKSNTLSQNQQNSFYQETFKQKPQFEVKIDTFAEHRPIFTDHRSIINDHRSTTDKPNISELKTIINNTILNPITYSPYVSKIKDCNLTPTRIKQSDRISVSPIKPRISFIKTQNPVPQNKQSGLQWAPTIYQNYQNEISHSGICQNDIPPPGIYHTQSEKLGSLGSLGGTSRISYQTTTYINGNQKLQTSNVQKLEMGQRVNLRPLSPIGKFVEFGNNIYQGGYQRSHSPIKVQFCTSRVSTINPCN